MCKALFYKLKEKEKEFYYKRLSEQLLSGELSVKDLKIFN
jgi:hypothetical protein